MLGFDLAVVELLGVPDDGLLQCGDTIGRRIADLSGVQQSSSTDQHVHGVVRISADPDNEKAEFAIIVHHEMTGLGLGVFLMRRIIDYARDRGINELYGDVLAGNQTMLKLCQVMGFSQTRSPEDFGNMLVTLRLD